ncbi:MAG TPA: division/cell wall cluster transcriptional repressor MraZ [Terracidiphilus sp.]|jgi:MraZ protein|nr:division/cell wall cluster transcriptional repressor MraZ [Terracidiphilus sp.]
MSENQEPAASETPHEAIGQGAGAWDELKYGFSGNPKTKLDERGRLKMPAEFKSFIERKYGKGFSTFYITSMDGESAEIYPLPEWLERQKKVFAMPQSNPARKMLLTRYNLYGDRADMDPQGRMQIPEELRTKADLSGEVKVSGEGNLLRVTSLKSLRQSVEGSQMTPELLDSLSEFGL